MWPAHDSPAGYRDFPGDPAVEVASPAERLVDIAFEQVRIHHVPSVLVRASIFIQVPAVEREVGHRVFHPAGSVVIRLLLIGETALAREL